MNRIERVKDVLIRKENLIKFYLNIETMKKL